MDNVDAAMTNLLSPIIHSTLPIMKKKYVEILFYYRWLFVKGNIIIGEWGIFGVGIFLHNSPFFIKGDFIIGGVECTANRKTQKYAYIKSELSSTMHLCISLDNTLHFYWYLKTYMLTEERQVLLLNDMLIQDRAQQLQYMKFSTYHSHMATFQLSIKSTTNT